MTRNGKIAAGIAATVLVIGAVGAIAGRHGHWGHGGGWRHYGGAFGFGAPMGAFCRGDGAEMADHLLVRLNHRLKPTDAQKPALEEFSTAIKAAAAKMQAACPPAPEKSADGKPAAKAPTERLAEAEVALAAALEAVRTVRPAADKFYATLTDEQKAVVAKMGPGRRHGHHWGRRGWRDRDDDERGPPPGRGPDKE